MYVRGRAQKDVLMDRDCETRESGRQHESGGGLPAHAAELLSSSEVVSIAVEYLDLEELLLTIVVTCKLCPINFKLNGTSLTCPYVASLDH